MPLAAGGRDPAARPACSAWAQPWALGEHVLTWASSRFHLAVHLWQAPDFLCPPTAHSLWEGAGLQLAHGANTPVHVPAASPAFATHRHGCPERPAGPCPQAQLGECVQGSFSFPEITDLNAQYHDKSERTLLIQQKSWEPPAATGKKKQIKNTHLSPGKTPKAQNFQVYSRSSRKILINLTQRRPF